jgi:hypothetical protein
MLSFQKLTGFIGSYGKYRQVDWTELLADFLENSRIAGISRIVYFVAEGRFDDEPSPETSVEVREASPCPVTSRHKGYSVLSAFELESELVHPVHELLLGVLGKDVASAQTSYEKWIVALMKLSDGLGVQMVGVVVADENDVDGRKLVDLASRRSVPPSGFAFFENGVNDEVIRPNLDDCSGVSDPGVPDILFGLFLEVCGHHWKFLLYELEIFFSSWCSFACGFMGHFEANVVPSPFE